MKNNKNFSLQWAQWLTLFGMGGIGLAIQYFALSVDLKAFYLGEIPLIYQILGGSLFGLVAAIGGWQIVLTDYLKPVRLKFSGLFQQLNLSVSQIVVLSFCAGIGEEILFRGAIQPYLGIWLTAFLFVAIHGYLNPKNLRISIYGLYMTLVIAALGYLTVYAGILSAIFAHTVIDIYLLMQLSKKENA